MFFSKEIKVTHQFGESHIELITTFLENYFSVQFLDSDEIEMELILHTYLIDGYEVTFMTEGMVGISLIGKKSILKKVINKVLDENPNLFELIHKRI